MSSGSLKASVWGEPIWHGQLKFTRDAIVLTQGNSLFAICPLDNKSCVTRTSDSRRFFLIKLRRKSNQHPREVTAGIGFQSREAAAEFIKGIDAIVQDDKDLFAAAFLPQDDPFAHKT